VLTAVLNRCCTEARVSPALVGTAGDLRELVRWHLAGKPEGELPDLLGGWRANVCGRLLLDVLGGQRTLRIVDAASDLPVALDHVGEEFQEMPTPPTTDGNASPPRP